VLTLTAATGALLATHSWGNSHWARTANPFTLKLGDNLSSNWDAYLATTTSDWSQSSVMDTVIVAGKTTGRRCRPTAGEAEVCNASYGNTGWLGVAQIWASGSHITHGIVKVNDTYFNTATYNTPSWRNLVMRKEAGHIFGLGHNDEDFNTTNGTCMDYSNNPEPNQHPNFHDYQMLESIYAHLDSSTTVASAPPPAMMNLDPEGPGQWGKLMKSSKNGLKEYDELDFGNGHRIITAVTWVNGEARGKGRD
jgi:hypothetical protein